MATPDLSDKPGRARLTLTKGQMWSRLIRLQTNAKPPVAIDLTGSTFKAVIRKNPACPASGELTVTVTDAVDGRFTLTLPSEVSAELVAGAYAEDQRGAYQIVLLMTDSLGVERTMMIVDVQVLEV